jgi:predicted MFS family arabinose efflux permease
MNALSYLAVIVCLLRMHIAPQDHAAQNKHFLASMKEGFSYCFHFAPIRSIILLRGFTSLRGMPFVVIMPVYAKDIFHGDSHTLGLLMGATGMGALSGALFLASRTSVLGLGRTVVVACSTLGVGVLLFSHSTLLPFSLLMLLFSGFGMMVLLTSCNSILQSIVDEDMRGRVMSLYTMAFMGTVPFGNLLQGALSSRFGPQNTLLLGRICCIAGSLLFARQLPQLRKWVRPIYVRMGILSE